LNNGTSQLSGHPQEKNVNNNNNNNKNNASKKMNIPRFEHRKITTPPAGGTCEQQLTNASKNLKHLKN